MVSTGVSSILNQRDDAELKGAKRLVKTKHLKSMKRHMWACVYPGNHLIPPARLWTLHYLVHHSCSPLHLQLKCLKAVGSTWLHRQGYHGMQ